MSYTKEELRVMAQAPRPASGTPEYQRWRRARVACGLPTKLDSKKEKERKYNTEYQRKYRKAKACIRCRFADEDMVCRADCIANGLFVGGLRQWHCSLWKKAKKVRI